MPCPDENALVEFVQRGHEAGEADPLEEHLDGCPACRRLLAGFARAGSRDDRTPDLATAPSLREPAALAPGQTVGRYIVQERLGAGAMGVVYLARDPELDRKVAVKVIRGELAQGERGERFEQRLSREARAMARLDHPNVVAVHDVGSDAGVLFVAMDFVEGGTLRQWLSAAPRSTDQILDAFLAAARGLSAAHSAGLVHRDFKPDNVMVGNDGRVRVTDFGLARSSAGEEPAPLEPGTPPTATASAPGAIVGTPAYMAPEQMRAGAIDARTDVFSFCTALYEALYGERPFSARTFSELCFQVERGEVRKAPAGTKVPRYIRTELLRGLQAEPSRRTPSMEALLSSLSRQRRLRRLVWPLAASGLVAMACVAAALVWRAQVLAGRPEARVRRGLAVLQPKDLAGRPETAWLSPALAEMLGSELSRGAELRLARGEEVAQAAADLGLAGASGLSPPALAQLRLRLAADLVVSGQYQVTGHRLRLSLVLWDAASGARLADGADEGEQGALADLLVRAAARLRREVRIAPLAPAEAADVAASFPQDSQAARAYAEGLLQLRAFNSGAARASLSRAAALEPQSPRIFAALAQAQAELGYDQLAQQAAQRAFDQAGKLGREERLWIEGLLYETKKDWPRAVEIDRALFTFYPDNLDYGLRLAGAQNSANRPREALATIERLRKLPAPAGVDPRIDLVESDSQGAVSAYSAALAAAQRAAAAGAAMGARRILAQGKWDEGAALSSLGQPARAEAALRLAIEAFRAEGDKLGEAKGSRTLAILRAEAGDLDGARREFESALQAQRELGNRLEMAHTSINLGVVQHRARDLPGSRRRYEEALAIYTERGDQQGKGAAINNLGSIRHEQGDLAGATALFEQAIAVRRSVGDRQGLTTSLGNLARMSLLRAQLPLAREQLRQARALSAETGELRGTAYAATLEAGILLAEGKPAEAAPRASQSAQLFRDGRLNDFAVDALALQAKALLAQGRNADARRALESAPKGAELSASGRQVLALSRALVDGSSGVRVDAALEELRAIAARAEHDGFVADQLDARLAIGRVELKRGDGKAGRATLRALAKDARARGFALIAREAAVAAETRGGLTP